jgi:hypothetical protein
MAYFGTLVTQSQLSLLVLFPFERATPFEFIDQGRSSRIQLEKQWIHSGSPVNPVSGFLELILDPIIVLLLSLRT